MVATGAVYESETSRFDPALVRWKFPLTIGESWNQSLRDPDKPRGAYGPIQRHVTVGGYESVTTPAGTFNALRIRIFTNSTTRRSGAIRQRPTTWRGTRRGGREVREEQRSYQREKDGRDAATVPGQNATIELVSFTPGAS